MVLNLVWAAPLNPPLKANKATCQSTSSRVFFSRATLEQDQLKLKERKWAWTSSLCALYYLLESWNGANFKKVERRVDVSNLARSWTDFHLWISPWIVWRCLKMAQSSKYLASPSSIRINSGSKYWFHISVIFLTDFCFSTFSWAIRFDLARSVDPNQGLHSKEETGKGSRRLELSNNNNNNNNLAKEAKLEMLNLLLTLFKN